MIERPAYRSPAAVLVFLLTFALLLSADLISKAVSWDRLLIHESGTPPARVEIDSHTYEFIPKLLHFRLTANQGAVFGIGQGKRWFFVLVSVGAIVVLFNLFARTPAKRWPVHVLLAAFLAGVIGNMYDRITIGYVRDMLWMLPNWKWTDLLPFLPASAAKYDVFPWIFNLADSYLVTGVIVVIVHSLFFSKSSEPQMNADKRGLEEKAPA